MKVGGPLDMQRNELVRAVLQVLASAPNDTAKGQVWFNDVSKRPAYDNGTGLVDLADVASGSSGNGNWVRIGPLLVCWNTSVGSADVSESNAGMWRGSVSWTFPATFSAVPAVVSYSVSAARVAAAASSISTTGATLWHRAGSSSGTATAIGGIAVGLA
jgi:hypothetical protein